MHLRKLLTAQILAAIASGGVFAGSGCGRVEREASSSEGTGGTGGTTISGGAARGTPASMDGSNNEVGGDGGVGEPMTNRGSAGSLDGEPGAYNCRNPGFGTCCDYDMCFTQTELRSYLDLNGKSLPTLDAGFADADVADARTDAGACPNVSETWMCGGFSGVPWHKDGKCCYVVWHGSCC